MIIVTLLNENVDPPALATVSDQLGKAIEFVDRQSALNSLAAQFSQDMLAKMYYFNVYGGEVRHLLSDALVGNIAIKSIDPPSLPPERLN